MALKNVVLVVFLVVSVVVCKPRDSTALHGNNVIVQNPESQLSAKAETSTQTENNEPAVHALGRIACPHEEATEDVTCQEHCLPKGYSFGLCVNNVCSCV